MTMNTPLLDRVINDNFEKNKRIIENEEECTIVYGKDTFLPFTYPIAMDYKALESKYPFTCKENGGFNSSVLFDIKSNMTLDDRIHDAIRGYYYSATIHIYRGEWKC